jgi:hypothetical protein
MPSDLDNLKTRRTTVTARLAAWTDKANVGGEAGGVDYIGEKDALYRELEFLNDQISRLEGAGTMVASEEFSEVFL